VCEPGDKGGLGAADQAWQSAAVGRCLETSQRSTAPSSRLAGGRFRQVTPATQQLCGGAGRSDTRCNAEAAQTFGATSMLR
jgi:hypothetical protein